MTETVNPPDPYLVREWDDLDEYLAWAQERERERELDERLSDPFLCAVDLLPEDLDDELRCEAAEILGEHAVHGEPGDHDDAGFTGDYAIGVEDAIRIARRDRRERVVWLRAFRLAARARHVRHPRPASRPTLRKGRSVRRRTRAAPTRGSPGSRSDDGDPEPPKVSRADRGRQ